MQRSSLSALLLFSILLGCTSAPSDEESSVEPTTELHVQVTGAASTRTITGAPIDVCAGLRESLDGSITTEPVFTQLALDYSLMELQLIPRQDAYLATMRWGLVARFDRDDTAAALEPLLDIQDRVESAIDDGLLSATLHPSYPDVSSLFVLYVSNAAARTVRLSRFEIAADGVHYDPNSEDVLVEGLKVPGHDSHSGGVVRFGPDGFLYASIGDGGYIEPPVRNGQDTSNVLGKMIRIDVDVPSGAHYAIPNDNPFANGGTHPGEGLPEIYAWGLRNPFRWSFDDATGVLWLGDVGWAHWEEIDRIENGGNYGWPVMEGLVCIDPDCDPSAFQLPVAVLPHDLGSTAVMGGFVYHGNDLPELEGAYLFADYESRLVYALTDPYEAPAITTITLVGVDIVFLAPDERGEPLAVGLNGVERIVPAPTGAIAAPRSIAATGCMDVNAPSTLHPAFERYEVNVPLWSDGAGKDRFALLPEGGVATADASGDLSFPAGTVLAKEFWQGTRRLETRFLALTTDGTWNTVSYRWNDAQTDATLVTEPTFAEVGAADPWFFPSTAQCRQCHTTAAGGSLGLEIAQLDRTITIDGARVSQLDHWRDLGWLASTPVLTPLAPIDDDAVDVATRARDYLHANCSNCHRPGTGLRVALDLRRDTPLPSTGLCEAPRSESFGFAHVLEPGDPNASILLYRMSTTDTRRMPPIGRVTVDTAAVAVVRDWITAMPSCP